MRGVELSARRRREAVALGFAVVVVVVVVVAAASASHAATHRWHVVDQRQAHPQDCLKRLSVVALEEQLACLDRLERDGDAAAKATKTLSDFLAHSDGSTNHRVIAGVLNVLRSLGRQASSAGPTLARCLEHRAKLYGGRDKVLVVRLRAHLMLTLSEVGYPDSALPLLLDTLAHPDERMTALEIGVAARAVRSLGGRGRVFARYLLETLTEQYAEEELSLEGYQARPLPGEATTVQLEVVRTLGRVCAVEDREVLTVLRNLAADRGIGGWDPRLKGEARTALTLIESRGRKGPLR
jgi:hypothetical protein